MSKFRANYILIVLMALLFSVAYTSRLSSVVLVVSILLPAFSFLLMWINYFVISVKIDKNSFLAEKKEKFNVDIELRNFFLFPATPVKIIGNFSDSETGMINRLNIFVNLPPFTKVIIPIRNEFKYRGEYEITVDYVEIYDLLKMFNIKKRVDLLCTVIVLPRRIDLNKLENDSVAQSDRTRHIIGNNVNNFSHIREFREGDTLKNIHWKMTAKQDELMVKQYEDDENAVAVIFCDLNCYFDDTDLNYVMTDSVIEIGLALSNRFIVDSCNSEVIFKNEKSDCLSIYIVGNFHEFNQLFYRLRTIPIVSGILPVSDMLQGYRFSDESAGAVYVVSPVIDNDMANALDNLSKFIKSRIILICLNYAGADADIINAVVNSGVEIWDIDVDNIKGSINFYLK